MPPDELDGLLKKAFDAEKAPDFETTWRSAISELENRRKRSYLPQRIMIPAMAAVAIVAVIVAVALSTNDNTGRKAPPVANRQTGDASRLLMGLEEPDLPVSPLDGLDARWNHQSTIDGEAEISGEEEVELTNNMLGEGMFESPTDFLLEFEIPQWNGV